MTPFYVVEFTSIAIDVYTRYTAIYFLCSIRKLTVISVAYFVACNHEIIHEFSYV